MTKRTKKNTKIKNVKSIVPLFVIVLGVFYLFLRLNSNIYSYTSVIAPICTLNIPQTLSFADSQFTLKLRSADIKGNDWTTYDDAASWHLNSKTEECNKGNIVMWAHNRRGLFAELYKVTEGEMIEVAGASGIRKYKVVDIRDVNPNDLTLVNVDDDRLTMYTCDGFLDSKRRFVIAKPV